MLFLMFTSLLLSPGNDEADRVLTVLLSTAMFVGGFVGCVLDNTVPGKDKVICLNHISFKYCRKIYVNETLADIL